MKSSRPLQVCVLISPRGDVVTQVSPQFTLDDFYVEAASYACGADIPSGYASQAVFEKMITEGYSVSWCDLVPADRRSEG